MRFHKPLLAQVFLLAFMAGAFAKNEWPGPSLPGSLPGLVQQDYDLRMDQYDVKFYKIDLEVSDTSTYLKGSASVMVEVVTPLNVLVLDMLSDLSVDSVHCNGLSTDFLHENDQLEVAVPGALPAGTLATVTVFYGGLGQQKDWISGIYSRYHVVWNRRVTWTLSEPFAARNWFPCKQVLADKADSACVMLTVEDRLKAGSNGLLVQQVPLEGNKMRYEWRTRYPIAFYLLSYSVAEYRDYSFRVPLPGRNDSLLIQNYIYDTAACFDLYKDDIDRTGSLIGLYSTLYGTYPFHAEKYGHCLAPLGGGMEHQTMTTLGSFSFLLVAHEMAHQWFGDYVTCASWQDIWVNEGFASYAEYLANQYLVSQVDADLWMADAHSFILSEPDGSVYVPLSVVDDEQRIFDYRLSYKKGAAIVHMIRYEVQDDSLFFDILRTYLDRFQNGTARGDDFKTILEEKTARDFDAFFDQWYYGEGYPNLSVNWKQQNDTLYISALQTSSSTATPLFTNLTPFKLLTSRGDTVITRRLLSNLENWSIPMPDKVLELIVDPRKWILQNVTKVINVSDTQPRGSFYVVPNPAGANVIIHAGNIVSDAKLHLVDAAGRILASKIADRFPYELNLSGYRSGSYFAVLEYDDRFYTAKFIRR